jgi:TRAP-type C4-dicarboxylate transport system substrate-binding protein
MKKVLLVAFCLVVGAGLVCANGARQSGGSGSKVAVMFAGTEADTTPQSQMLHEVANRLNASGRFDVSVFTAGSLSNDTDDLVTQAIQGANIVVPSDPGRISTNQKVADFGILMAPYVLKDYQVLDKLLTTPLYQQWEKDFETAGVKLITNNFYNGMRHFVTNKEIKVPADLAGQRIRGFGNNIGNGLAKYLGYAQTSIAATEIYTGVQSKTIDGCELQTPTSYGYRLWEVLKYTTKTGHYMLTSSIVTGTKFFNSMSAEDQALFIKTFRDVCTESQTKVAQTEEANLAEMASKYGMIVSTVDTAPFEAAVQPLYNELGFSAGLKDRLFQQLGL